MTRKVAAMGAQINRRGLLQAGAAGAISAPLLAATAAPAHGAGSTKSISTDVAILGGGAAGLHTAYRLGQRTDLDVCVVEALDRLGGRIHDVALDRTRPDRLFGTGALRVMETQEYVFDLASELGIEFQAAPWQDDLVSARGAFANFSDDLAAAYPLVSMDEGALYDELRFGPLRARAASFPDFRSYVRAAVGTQGYHFLTDTFRFRADFQDNIDARSYLDYLDEEWDVCCTPYYPVGGMSQFIHRMATAVRRAGGRILLSEPAVQISYGKKPYRYVIRTPRYTIKAKRLVVGVDAQAFATVQGPVAEAITKAQQFQDLVGVKCVTVSQRWPSAWWSGLGEPGQTLRRAWTTEHALNALEIPLQPYAADQLVTRTVYDDDRRTVDFWENAAKRGTRHVEAEIMRGLHYLFPGTRIPDPLKTVVQVWPAAWYWLRGGSSYTNADIADWAVRPVPGEKISLVGESYNPQRSGWSDGAYKSSIRTLNAQFGLNVRLAATKPHRATCSSQGCRKHARA